jgi:hypothetical protein
MEKLSTLVHQAKHEILLYLKDKELCDRKELEAHVLSLLNVRVTRLGHIAHNVKPIYVLAFVLAFSELEREGEIKIKRPEGVPHPFTDFLTIAKKAKT